MTESWLPRRAANKPGNARWCRRIDPPPPGVSQVFFWLTKRGINACVVQPWHRGVYYVALLCRWQFGLQPFGFWFVLPAPATPHFLLNFRLARTFDGASDGN